MSFPWQYLNRVSTLRKVLSSSPSDMALLPARIFASINLAIISAGLFCLELMKTTNASRMTRLKSVSELKASRMTVSSNDWNAINDSTMVSSFVVSLTMSVPRFCNTNRFSRHSK